MDKTTLHKAKEGIERSLRIYQTDLTDDEVRRITKQIAHAIDWEDPVDRHRKYEESMEIFKST